MKKILFVVLLAFIFIGCLKPVTKLGCCLKENATIQGKCVLYNTTTFEEQPEYMDDTVSCNVTAGNCNVTISNETHLIPVCTEDQLVPCIAPNCTAMVCGDFVFTPRIAPGFISIEESEGDIPPDTEEAAAVQFYKAQCRFFPMDAKLRNIMKNSKSQLNVFRMGVGGSFDEFDQYRYFFPMSDKFCNLNPPLSADDKRVDRYMNYITAAGEEYDPIEELTENCLDDSDTVPEPFGFTEMESIVPRMSMLWGFWPALYFTKVPDQSNYNFSHHGRLDYFSEYKSGQGGYYRYNDPLFDPSDNVYKKINDEFYRRELSIAHVDTIYGLTTANTTRAPFECDIATSECYSGSCDTRVYNRGVLLDGVGNEVVADCNRVTDANGRTRVVCAPTKSVTSAGAGNPPNINYAWVDVIPARLEGDWNGRYKFEKFAENESLLDEYWDGFTDSDFADDSYEGSVRTVLKTLHHDNGLQFEWRKKKLCSTDYGTNDDEEKAWCSSVAPSFDGPPAGGIVFFGKLKDDKVVRYKGSTIIGYAVVRPEDFDDLIIVENCGMDMDEESPFPLPPDPFDPPEFFNLCTFDCEDLCPGMLTECSEYCYGNGTVAPPCTPPPPSILTETEDFIRVEIDGPNDPEWEKLMVAFKPYFQDMTSAITSKGFGDGCGKKINAYDPVVAAMPWVINHDKGVRYAGGDKQEYKEDEFLTSIAAQELRERNIYDEAMVTHSEDTSSCELRRSTMPWNPVILRSYYNLLFSKHIYLFKYKSDPGRIGSCAVDENTLLPQMKTFGWCNPCTTSTLAYQEISAYDRVYMPAVTGNIEGPVSTNEQTICEAEYEKDWHWMDLDITDNVSCYNQYITDMDEYKESIGAIGSPRTIPEASIVKERLGNYMKSGILPVLDLSDDSNWNITNPDFATYGESFKFFWWTETAAPTDYLEYDFERLFGNMGASVVIVEHISGNATGEEVERIVNRSAIIREKCFGCLVAFHVDSPPNNNSFNHSIDSVLEDPRADFNIDMVTFDYPISEPPERAFALIFVGGEGLAGEIAKFGRIALQSYGKPTMVVGLSIQNYDWEPEVYERIFIDLIAQQDELVRAGVTGIIYSPVRTTEDEGAGSEGLVIIDDTGLGFKGPKFCAYQKAMEVMSTNPPTALFTRATALDSVNCTKCTSLDLAQGSCDTTCDNGIDCTMPGDAIGEDYRCPANTVLEPCQLCNETGGTYECTLSYADGTEETIPGPMSELSSEFYLDRIGGIPKPDKCCLRDELSGQSYTFMKQSFASPINKPIVFPKTGDPTVDCGFGGDSSAMGDISSFCGMEMIPIKDYDIECTIG